MVEIFTRASGRRLILEDLVVFFYVQSASFEKLANLDLVYHARGEQDLPDHATEVQAGRCL